VEVFVAALFFCAGCLRTAELDLPAFGRATAKVVKISIRIARMRSLEDITMFAV
jgi:hypothetical protein